MRSGYKLKNKTAEGCLKELQGLWIKPNPDKYNSFKIGLFHGMMLNYMAVYDAGYNVVRHVWKCTITYGHGGNGLGEGRTQRQAIQAAVDNMFKKGCKICSHEDVIQIGESYEKIHAQPKGRGRKFCWEQFKGLERPSKGRKATKTSEVEVVAADSDK